MAVLVSARRTRDATRVHQASHSADVTLALMKFDIDLPTPTAFPAFPFSPPYEIQVELMRHLYTSIEQRKVTVVESPTGTGKTLSLLCASLTWLKDEKDRAKKGKLRAIAGDDGDGSRKTNLTEAKDWVVEQTRERVRREMEADEREYEVRLAEAKKREDLLKKMSRARVVKKIKQDIQTIIPTDDENDDKFLPENESHGDDEEMNISPALRALMEKVEKSSRPGRVDESELTCTKIYYASRTHSQLTQVLPELQRLKLYSNVTSHHPSDKTSMNSTKKRPLDELESTGEAGPNTRTVALGSRKQLCINDELREKSRDLDEGCRELLGEKEHKRCQYLPPVGNEEKMLDLRDQILVSLNSAHCDPFDSSGVQKATPKDIEDLAAAGRRAQTCPYFGARRAIPQAQLVTLPYNLLLQRTAREALGIDLTDQIVIIDEAHSNWSLSSFVNVELSAVHARKVARKISGYCDKEAEKNNNASRPRRGEIPSLNIVETFLVSLTGATDDGRVTLTLVGTPGNETVELKFQLLNPSPPFKEVVDVARSVILAGGTMSPVRVAKLSSP
ncbi:hypothetical protein C0995_000167 [Termitomyces sp. Mi166|nr:hypothetical protein C0995_000167 [Termitomyces sp. Mi166\